MHRTQRCLIVLVLSLFPISLFGQTEPSMRDPLKEEPIYQELKTVAPKAIDIFKAATTALDSQRYDEALPLYEQVLKQAPNFEPALRREGYVLVALGRRQEGIAAAQKAVDLHRILRLHTDARAAPGL